MRIIRHRESGQEVYLGSAGRRGVAIHEGKPAVEIGFLEPHRGTTHTMRGTPEQARRMIARLALSTAIAETIHDDIGPVERRRKALELLSEIAVRIIAGEED